jgi:hypothetical protein
MKKLIFAALFFIGFGNIACKEESTVNPNATGMGKTSGTGTGAATGTTTATDYSTNVIKAFTAYGAKNLSSVTVDCDYILIKTNGVPDHKSPYFKGSTWESTLYVNDTRGSFILKRKRIAKLSLFFNFDRWKYI